jgi:1-acyl-sn-glycerol-3-phosphate acyltransferase
LLKKGDYVIKGINGIENYLSVKGGAIITCNHFSVTDNYTVYRAIRDYLPKGHFLYKVIREGNYTNFKGLFGFLFKHCNTLPLSSNFETMKMFLSAVSTLLKRGEKILIYPEQGMWWNYRKPRPMKSGAFSFAVKNDVPIIPVFITMEDTDVLDPDGFPVQAYTMHVLKPIYPDKNLSQKQNIEMIKDENYRVWKETYEKTYKIPLVYSEEVE